MSLTPLSVKLNVLAISIMLAVSLTVSAAGIVTIDRLTNKLSDPFLRLESKKILNKLQALRDSGFRVAVGDFGNGHIALSYLQKFAIDHQKIAHVLTSAPSV